MLPKPGFFPNQAAVQELNQLMLDFHQPVIVRNAVERKNIDKNTLMHGYILEKSFHEKGVILLNLGKVVRSMRVCFYP